MFRINNRPFFNPTPFTVVFALNTPPLDKKLALNQGGGYLKSISTNGESWFFLSLEFLKNIFFNYKESLFFLTSVFFVPLLFYSPPTFFTPTFLTPTFFYLTFALFWKSVTGTQKRVTGRKKTAAIQGGGYLKRRNQYLKKRP